MSVKTIAAICLLLTSSAFAKGNFSFKGYGIKPFKPGKHVTVHMAKLPKLGKGQNYVQKVLAHQRAIRVKQERENKIMFERLMRQERRK